MHPADRSPDPGRYGRLPMADLASLVAALRTDPSRTAVLLDFDGTLAPIVDDPATAAPLPEARDLLRALADVYARVAVVSGRPVSYLQEHLPSGPALVGLYGLEWARGDAIEVHAAAAGWRRTVDDVAAAAVHELPTEVGVEHKGLSLTLHVRSHPELAGAVDVWAAAAAERSGLQVRRARMSAELHPPIAADKGTAVEALIAGCVAACFIGDDVGDLAAFDALDRFALAGGTAVRLVVESTETDPALLARADAVVAGPAAVIDVLSALVGS